MREIIEEMQSNGFSIDSLTPDGKLHRFQRDRQDHKKSGWYIAFQNYARKSGEQFYVALYGDWKSGDRFTFNSKIEFSAEDKKAVKDQIEKAQKAAEAEKQKLQSEAALECEQKWESLVAEGSTPYLVKKRIDSLYGARRQEDRLYVPTRDIEGRLWGLQSIGAQGEKYFFPGQRVQGCFHLLGEMGDGVAYLCEGFATGASIHMATGSPVLVAFNASNLVHVASAVKKKFPELDLVVAADNDLWATRTDGTPFNPGKEKAEEASKRCMATMVLPRFKSMISKPTDFNDLHVLEGLEVVKEQLQGTKIEKVAVIPLGFKDGEYYFTSSDNQQVVPMSSFSDVQFFNLMRKEYWEGRFPGQKGGIDWQMAKSEMMAMARRKGIFEPKSVRGSGVWYDEGRVVINLGDRLIVDGAVYSIHDFKSRYFYTLGKKLPMIHDQPLRLEECKLLTGACAAFKWQKRDSAMFLAGGLIVARVCGAIPIRPHLWITGSAQTGKSTLLERLVYPSLSGFSLYFQGGTSEAGIRQSLAADSLPVIFDEFETTNWQTSEKVQSIVELMRQSWSETHGFIAKGSASGAATLYQPRFSAVVSGIRPNLQNDADISRFAVLELAPHGNDAEHWMGLEELLNQIDSEYIDRLFSRSVQMLPILLENYKRIKLALAQKVSQRVGQQYGMLLAGYALLTSDEALGGDEIDGLVDALDLDDQKAQAAMSDQVECLHHLMTKKVTLDFGGAREERSIGEIVQIAQSNDKYRDALVRYGILVESPFLYVANTHTELRALFGRTRWDNCWDRSLSRIQGARRGTKKYFGPTQIRTVQLALSSA